ncbi:elongation of fatty acids protein 3-like [Jatropha curcas]|uniref:elongation of fatty acids protein 3-like n=1 Tax=Jatropha curcas TaxID=180498 RepID=UPI0005FB10C1|nr:elongation of fatty acids protein 3-like [Jatropha curcas]
MASSSLQGFKNCLSEHPSIVNFRWSITQTWGSTWSFIFSAIAIYIAAAITIHFLLSLLLSSNRRIPLGPIPAIHSLTVALISTFIFIGLLFSTVAEIRDTRWFWRRTKTTTVFHWLLCFPLGTRPTGRVFFWSYVFYLSRFLHLFRTFFTILQYRKLTYFTLFNQSILLLMSFLWLEFSQSFQVLAILLTTLLYSVVYGYRFWIAIGLPRANFLFITNCQVVLLVLNLLCHFGVLFLHFLKGGCNGIVAWSLNSVLNGMILVLFLRFYVKIHLIKRRARAVSEFEVSAKSKKAS